MVKGPVHDHFAEFLDLFVMAVAGPTWHSHQAPGRDDLDTSRDRARHRGRQLLLSGSGEDRDRAGGHQSAGERCRGLPQSRPGHRGRHLSSEGGPGEIYAALGVAELWIFDGQTLTIERLDEKGRYQAVERSGFLPVRADQVPRWLTAEDSPITTPGSDGSGHGPRRNCTGSESVQELRKRSRARGVALDPESRPYRSRCSAQARDARAQREPWPPVAALRRLGVRNGPQGLGLRLASSWGCSAPATRLVTTSTADDTPMICYP